MKNRYMVLGLGVLLAFSLTSCGGQQAQEPQEPKEPTQEIQQAEPISTQPVVAPEEVKQEVAPAVLEEGRSVQDGDTSEEVDGTGEIEPAEEDQLFTPVEETVYATGTVNIRASWSVESEKLGALSKGDVVTRTGTAIEGTEADGWSRVKISDGQAEDGTERFKDAYVSTKFISTAKPSAQQQATSKPSSDKGNNQGTQQDQDPSVKMPGGTPIGGTPTTGSTTQTPQGQPNISEPQDTVGLTPEEKEAATRALLGDLSGFVDGTWDEIYGN